MALEIEIKVRVASLDVIRNNLGKNGSLLIAEQDEHDIYYNAPHRDFAVTDEALRVRYTVNQTCGKPMPPNVTYKGPKTGREGFKAREELIVDISSGEEFAAVLGKLDFTRTAEVVKHREIYRYGSVIVTLDNVAGVGLFSEIEADLSLSEEEAVKAIEEAARANGISGERLTKSYLELLLDVQKK
jgi:adenylate cyclase class 2